MNNEKLVQRFAIITSPHVADPSWAVPLTDITDADNPIQYSSFEPLKNLISKCEWEMAKKVGEATELNRICEMFGVKSYFELQRLADACLKYMK